MNQDSTFHIYGAPHEGETITHLSKAELKHLKKRNKLRALQLFRFIFWVAFMISLPLGLLIGLSSEVRKPIDFVFIFLVALCVLMLFFVWKGWGKVGIKPVLKMKWQLPLNDVKVIELTGHFGVRVHPTSDNENLWTINNAIVDFPEHWALGLDKIISNFNKPELVTFKVAKLPQATGDVARLPLRPNAQVNFFSNTRTDIVLPDPKYVVLEAGPFSIEKDISRGIPINRNNPFFLQTGIFYLILSAIIGTSWYTVSDLEKQDITNIQRKIIRQESNIGLERSMDSKVFNNRDFPELSPHKDYGNKVLVGDSLKFVQVIQKNDPTQTPFILSVNEYRLIYRLATINTWVILGYGNTANSKHISEYRSQLLNAINKLKDIPEPLRALQKNNIQKLSNALIEKQLRSYGNRSEANPEFIAALLPKPLVQYSNGLTTPYCIQKPVFCTVNSNKIKVETLPSQFTIHNDNIKLFNTTSFNYLEELKLELQQTKGAFKHSVWIGWLAIIIGSIGTIGLLMFFIARRKTKQFYK